MIILNEIVLEAFRSPFLMYDYHTNLFRTDFIKEENPLHRLTKIPSENMIALTKILQSPFLK